MRSLPIDIREDKTALRRYFREIRAGIPPALRQEKSLAILRALTDLSLYRDCETVLLYAPIGSEVDLLALGERALADGKAVAFPRSHTEDCTMTFHAVTDLAQLSAGAYGIREPDEALPILHDYSEALCLIPALALDTRGFRLGYGKGYYDRFLSTFSGRSAGVCFGDCLCDRLPNHPHDRRVDLILTEGGTVTPYEEA